FGGTGMTGYAGIMMKQDLNVNKQKGKRNVIVSDLSPYASFISSNFNSNFNILNFKKSFEHVLKKLKDSIGDYWNHEGKKINYVNRQQKVDSLDT
ncbi:MAG: hypothetical protein RSE50_14090, partial [Myroides sp.]